jgi:hypothetical protein
MKKMGSPSAVEVAVATARVDPGAIAATTTETRFAAAMVCLVQIPSLYRCLHRRMIIGKRTRGYQEPRGFAAFLLGGAQAPLSNHHFKQLSREIAAAQPSVKTA